MYETFGFIVLLLPKFLLKLGFTSFEKKNSVF